MSKYKNTSNKTLNFRSEKLEPGKESELKKADDSEIENFVERGYLEEVGSGAESTSASQKLSEKERKLAEADLDEELMENVKKLEGIGDSKAKDIGLDFDNWEDFKQNVSREYMEELGLREDQINANLEKHMDRIE